MISNKKANILIYSIILTFIGVSFGIILMNNSLNLLLVKNSNQINNLLIKNIDNKNKIIQEYIQKTNSDGSGFIDILRCPKSFTMKYTIMMGWFPVITEENDIDSNLKYEDGLDTKFYCSGFFEGSEIKIFFNSTFDDVSKAEYKGKEINVNSAQLDGTFHIAMINYYFNLEHTNNYYQPDSIDDNFNSDNYSGNNSGILNYPENYQDNDDYIKKNIIGTVYPKKTQNIFWNNSKIEKFIDDNTNNTGSLNINLSKVEEGNIFLEVDNNIDLKLIKFNKTKFDDLNEIKKQETLTGTISGSGYIKNNGGTLELDQTIDGDTYDFDFKNNGYMLFLKNKSDSNYINYYLSGKDNSGSGIILAPIDDSKNNFYNYLGYDIWESENGNFYNIMRKVIGKK